MYLTIQYLNCQSFTPISITKHLTSLKNTFFVDITMPNIISNNKEFMDDTSIVHPDKIIFISTL